MPKIKKYTDKDFENAVKDNVSIAGTLRQLKLQPTGGNYKIANARIKSLDLDTSHFTGQGYLKGKKHNWSKKIPLKEILIEDSSYQQTYKLKNRLIKEEYFEEKCSGCGLEKWRNQKIPLELEHINGINNDNRLENLTLLCPNCHAQTSTHRGKNKGKH